VSHHFQAKGGTVFNFNSDLSGDVRVHRSAEHDDRAELPAADLLEFVDWYRRTPGYGVDEEALSETLTEEERKQVELTLSVLAKNSGAYPSLAKLLRLHDALQARVKEAARLLQDARENYWGECWKTTDIDAWLAGSPNVGCLECSELKRERNETMRLLEEAQARVKELESEREHLICPGCGCQVT
jgi:hypothetical protein